MFASVKLMFGLAVDIPKLKPAIVMADGPLFVKFMSSELPDEPEAAKTDWPDKITPARPVADPRRKKALPTSNQDLNGECCFGIFVFGLT